MFVQKVILSQGIVKEMFLMLTWFMGCYNQMLAKKIILDCSSNLIFTSFPCPFSQEQKNILANNNLIKLPPIISHTTSEVQS